jgi:nicotinamidase-related amidase
MAIWDATLTERDKQVFAKAGYGKRQGFGQRPAILVIDMNYNFVGDKPEPILKSIERFRNSCGEEGWEGVKRIRDLLDAARPKHLPIFYTTSDERRHSSAVGRWQGKNTRAAEDHNERWARANDIVADIAPQDGEIIIRKQKPSAFFGTPLMAMLNEFRCDTVLMTGCTTSGCVRASVIDAFSYNFRVAVVEECVFDRGEASHRINLFDMNAKYADVIPVKEAIAYVKSLPETLFAPGL